jgi:hypothetical protein
MTSWFLHYLGDFVSILIGVSAMGMISIALCYISSHTDWGDEIEEIELGNYASFISTRNDRNSSTETT